jgi:hypothetical protein
MSTTTVPNSGSASVPAAATAPRGKVTQLRVITSEWIKFRSLRSTYLTLIIAVLAMIGLAALICWATASRWTTMPAMEKVDFDPAGSSLDGYRLAQLAIGTLGVMVVTGEYSTGMIRATLSAVPRRLPVLWAKAAVFGAATFVVTAVASLLSFAVGQSMLSSQHIQTSLSASGVSRVLLGTALYLTLVGLLGVGLGTLVRSTPGGIASVFGALLVLPLLTAALPASWANDIAPYLPSTAGESLTMLHTHAPQLSPWTGGAVFALYVAASVIGGAIVLKRRDA